MAATLAAETHDSREASHWDRRQVTWFVVAIALFTIYPFVDRALGINRLGSWLPIFVTIILAMGLNIVVGYAGLLDLGYAAFFAIGAYTNAILTSPRSGLVQNGYIPEFLQHFWPAMAISWVVAAIFGVFLGAPTLRLRGDYLAIVTLGFGEIVPNVVVNTPAVTGGPLGLNPISAPPPIPLPGGYDIRFGASNQIAWYFLMFAVGLFSLFLINRLHDSRLGRSWMAVREDEIAAASMGINLVKTKLLAFALGASFSGFAGSVYAAAFQYVNPSQFEFTVSISVLSMVILGGLGNIYGVIFGGLIIASFDRILAEELNGPMHWLGRQTDIAFLEKHDLNSDRLLVFGLALVVMMLVRPGGLFPNARREAELTEESEEVTVRQDQQLYDIRHENEPAVGERA